MTGQYFHNIDAKGRLFIPAKLREQLGDTLHVTVGQDGCLSVYSDAEWEKFQQKLDERNFTDVKKLRLMFAYMADCEPGTGPHPHPQPPAPAGEAGKGSGGGRYLQPCGDLERPALGRAGGGGLFLRFTGAGDGRNGAVRDGI